MQVRLGTDIGNSSVGSTGEPSQSSTVSPRSVAAPIVDTVALGLAVGGVGYAATSSDSGGGQPSSHAVEAALGAGLAVAYGVSAVYGYRATAACEEAEEDRFSRLAPPAATAEPIPPPPAIPAPMEPHPF